MGYVLFDRESYLGDFASAAGILGLRGKSKALDEFLKAGVANDKNLIQRVIEETAKVKDLAYIAEMLKDAEPPVIISDGIADVTDPSDWEE